MEQHINQFNEWRKLINEWHKYHKTTSPGTTRRLQKRFEQYEFNYFKLITEYRKTKQPSLLSKANNIHLTASAEIKSFKRLELLGTLAK